MASSKKYGYQLRGEKLALCELDITGSGNGLNYTYEENAGLDIATDPSSWKSPLTSVDNGLQIEYLANDLRFNQETFGAGFLTNVIPNEFSTMDDVSYLSTPQDDWIESFGSTLSHPARISQATLITDSTPFAVNNNNTNFDLGTSVAKIVKTLADATGGQTSSVIGLGKYNMKPGKRYRVSFDWYLNCKGLQVGNVSAAYTLGFGILDPDSDTPSWLDINTLGVENLNNCSVASVYKDKLYCVHPGSSFEDSYHTGWANTNFEFICTKDIMEFGIHMNPMHGTTTENAAYFDNLKVVEFDEGITSDEIDSEIILPSYAQKALLDYVRAQESYEGGDLQKWDFFMKQFRSKLERWEDSRITGPRVLGPHGPSSIR